MLIEKVVKSLSRHHVKYILVGGYAVALHGAVRGTVDIDFLGLRGSVWVDIGISG